MSTNERNSDLVCLFCGTATSRDEPREHIFPKSMGGDAVMPIGDVCRNCNTALSDLERSLKRENPVMAESYQIDDFQKGRRNSPERKQRQSKQKKYIEGEGFKVKFDKDASTLRITSVDLSIYRDKFVRTLHKFAIELVCKEVGSRAAREKYPEIIDFVMNGTNPHLWSYAASYRRMIMFNEGFIRPWELNRCIVDDKPIAICIIHTSGIYIIGLKPNTLNLQFIQQISQHILNSSDGYYYEHLTKNGPNFDHYFDSKDWKPVHRLDTIGQLNFIWIRKHVKPKQRSEDLHLLVRCKICGQTNPTGIQICRNAIHGKSVTGWSGGIKNDWNRYTICDLIQESSRVDKISKQQIDSMLDRPIYYPAENKDKIFGNYSGTVRCLCCHNPVSWSKNDLFL